MTPILAVVLLSGAVPYVAHEWGTFTAVVDENGTLQKWRPLDFKSDLPSFVNVARWDKGSSPPTTIRMETPVIYFYPRESMTVRARVAFPDGRITEIYPPPMTLRPDLIDWGDVRLTLADRRPLKKEPPPSHYYPAREVDAATVEANGAFDRFLFYRGTGDFELPMKVKLEGEAVHVSGARGATIVFERKGAQLGFAVLAKGQHHIARPALHASIGDARAALLDALISTGLYEKEARAMLATQDDSWFEEGLRVFALLEAGDVERVLPLTLEPRPTELIRVLVGRIEVLTVERQDAAAREPEKVGQREGRFAMPLLILAGQKRR